MDLCKRCSSHLTPIVEVPTDQRKGAVGELRCEDLTCPYSDHAQGEKWIEG